jgi:hypothetical protein
VFCGEHCDAKVSALLLHSLAHESYASQHQDNAANKPEKRELCSVLTHEQPAPPPADVCHVMQVCTPPPTPPPRIPANIPSTQTRITPI